MASTKAITSPVELKQSSFTLNFNISSPSPTGATVDTTEYSDQFVFNTEKATEDCNDTTTAKIEIECENIAQRNILTRPKFEPFPQPATQHTQHIPHTSTAPFGPPPAQPSTQSLGQSLESSKCSAKYSWELLKCPPYNFQTSFAPTSFSPFHLS